MGWDNRYTGYASKAQLITPDQATRRNCLHREKNKTHRHTHTDRQERRKNPENVEQGRAENRVNAQKGRQCKWRRSGHIDLALAKLGRSTEHKNFQYELISQQPNTEREIGMYMISLVTKWACVSNQVVEDLILPLNKISIEIF